MIENEAEARLDADVLARVLSGLHEEVLEEVGIVRDDLLGELVGGGADARLLISISTL